MDTERDRLYTRWASTVQDLIISFEAQIEDALTQPVSDAERRSLSRLVDMWIRAGDRLDTLRAVNGRVLDG